MKNGQKLHADSALAEALRNALAYSLVDEYCPCENSKLPCWGVIDDEITKGCIAPLDPSKPTVQEQCYPATAHKDGDGTYRYAVPCVKVDGSDPPEYKVNFPSILEAKLKQDASEHHQHSLDSLASKMSPKNANGRSKHSTAPVTNPNPDPDPVKLPDPVPAGYKCIEGTGANRPRCKTPTGFYDVTDLHDQKEKDCNNDPNCAGYNVLIMSSSHLNSKPPYGYGQRCGMASPSPVITLSADHESHILKVVVCVKPSVPLPGFVPVPKP